MDWNHDGKHDWKDDAFYNNVVSDESKQRISSSYGSHGGSSSSSSSGCAWFVVLCVIYFLIKLFSWGDKMDEIIELLTEIRDYLSNIDSKLDDINGKGLYSIEDVVDKLDDIGSGINDLVDKIEYVE